MKNFVWPVIIGAIGLSYGCGHKQAEGGERVEREELERLFRDYGDDVFRLAYSYLASRPDAEDVTQAVFLKLAEGRTRPSPGKEKAFLLKCAANACKNTLRSFWRRNVGELDETLLFKDEGDREIYAAVKALPPKYRAVVHLYYFEGYDQGEIGEILRISRTAVQTRMSRARAMLRKELGENEGTLPAHDGACDAG